MKKTLLLLATSMLLSGQVLGDAKASQPTAAGAQKFLGLSFAQKDSEVTFTVGYDKNRVGNYYYYYPKEQNGETYKNANQFTREPFKILGATADGGCVTHFEVDQFGEIVRHQPYNFMRPQELVPQPFVEADDLIKAGASGDTRWKIDWGSVSYVGIKGKDGNAARTVEIVLSIEPAGLPGKKFPTVMRIVLPAEPVAARAAYAMDFLRLKCDGTAGTGF